MLTGKIVGIWGWVVGAMLALVGCSGDSPLSGSEGEAVAIARQALTADQQRILGWEAPASTDWSTNTGTLSQSSVFAQGTTALAIDRPQAWTEICSTQLSSLGSVGDSVSFQLYMEESTPSFGEVRVLLRAPSLGLWNAELTPVSIQNKAPGVFHTISSALGAHSGPLSSNYTDLRICVVINAESGRYVLDDLRFSGITTSASTTTTSTTSSGGTTGSGGTQGTTGSETSTTGGGNGGTGDSGVTGGSGGSAGTGGDSGTSGDGGTGGEPGGDLSQCIHERRTWDQLVVQFPRGTGMTNVALAAQGGKLEVHDGVAVRTGDGSGFANITALMGSGLTDLGATAESGNLLSGLPVNLRSNSTVHGFVKTGSTVTTQTGAQVEQSTLENFDHEPYAEVGIPYRFPETYNSDPILVTNGSSHSLPPGAYGTISVQAQSTLSLGPGEFYLDGLSIEPGSHLQIDNAQAGASIFVRGQFSLKVTPEYTAPDKFNVLFGVVGTGPVTLEQNFRGTLIAPEADVVLPTATISAGHHGSIVARSIVAHQHTDFYFHPYQRDAQDCSVVDPEGLGGIPGCPPKDTDGDGIPDCVEENDDNDWTDPQEYDGVRVQLAELCHQGQGLVHEDVDSLAEVEACLDNAAEVEEGRSGIAARWPAIGGGDICSFEYGLDINWANCRATGQVHVDGVIRIDEPRTQCFQVIDGSTSQGPNSAIGVLFVGNGGQGITALDGVTCLSLPVGIHGVRWFYEFTGRPTHNFRIATCTQQIGFTCDPTRTPDWGGLRDIPIDDLLDAKRDGLLDTPTVSFPCQLGQCARQCPCDTGGECDSDADCSSGVCGENNGGHFGLVASARVCWAGGCDEDPYTVGCGGLESPCGTCVSLPNGCASDADCASGNVCGMANGFSFGLSAQERVCWPAICESDPEAGGCGTLESPCGVCLCRPSCDGKQCGDANGCGGLCPLCTPFDTIEGGCSTDEECAPGFACAPNGYCADPLCRDRVFLDENCGIGETCGPCVDCPSTCGDKECGVDPCGNQCGAGTCSAELSCVGGSCVPTPEQSAPDPVSTVGRLPGTLSVTPNGSPLYRIPIEVPPGRAGLQPELSIEYVGGKEDGPLGLGWKLVGLPHIARCPVSTAQAKAEILGTPWPGRQPPIGRPVRFDESDRFCLGDEMLFPEDGIYQNVYGADGTAYRTERETFTRVISVGNPYRNGEYVGPESFIAYTKSGLIHRYGATDQASVFVRPHAKKMKRTWALEEIRDRAGNTIEIEYSSAHDTRDADSETLQLLPLSIKYGPGDRAVRFRYSHWRRPRQQYTVGNSLVHVQGLSAIETLVGERVVRRYEFTYEEPDTENGFVAPVLLKDARECVFEGTGKTCKAATVFEYEQAQGVDFVDIEVPIHFGIRCMRPVLFRAVVRHDAVCHDRQGKNLG